MKYKKVASANGELDRMAIRAEEYASYLTKRNRPPHVTLERIANIAEKVMNYKHTKVNRHGNTVVCNRTDQKDARERQRDRCLARVWKAYESVQKTEILHKDRTEDESWNNAKENRDTKKWIPDPVYYYGDALEEVLSDDLHGDKKNGITKPKSTEY
jgi:hypothetical protein